MVSQLDYIRHDGYNSIFLFPRLSRSSAGTTCKLIRPIAMFNDVRKAAVSGAGLVV